VAEWEWVVLAVVLSPVGLFALAFAAGQLYYRSKYLGQIVRIFEEKPLFIVPRGKPVPDAEDVTFPTDDGLNLRGCYLTARRPRKGVLLFGLEFGSNRWAELQYCSELLDAGNDHFAYEPRNQGESDKDAAYDPLQWVTDKDLSDARAAVAYLKARPDAPADGIGLLGVSKGGSVGLLLAASDPWVRCAITDGAYATHTTMVPYMRRWVHIYIKSYPKLRRMIVPDYFYALLGRAAVRRSAERRQVQFLDVEQAIDRMRQPLLMIHGGADTYIKPEMAEALFAKASGRPKELWLIPGAKHNQGLHTAGADYHRRLVEFFDQHLGRAIDPPADSAVLPPPDAPAPAENEGSGRLATASAE
jgi:dipeptidyl aminopeptidase/acylaminoacyl peptidase